MKRNTSIWFLLLMLLFSCSNNTQCPTGKARKTKAYKIKQWKPYDRGYRVARNDDYENSQAQLPTPEKKEDIEATTIQPIASPIELEEETVSVIANNIPITNTPQTKDTVRIRTVIKSPPDTISEKKEREFIVWNREPTAYIPPDEKTKDTLRKTTTVRLTDIDPIEGKDVDVGLSNSNGGKPEIQFDPQTQVVYKDKVYEKDEDFVFDEIVEFVPNYDILLYPEKANEQVDSLVKFLKENPEKRIYIYGNGGYDDADERDEFDLNNRWVGDPLGISGRWVKTYFGRGNKVYDQIFTGLGNSDPYEVQRIKQEGRRKLSGYERVKIGDLLYARARTIENFLASKGINKKRMIPKRGEFLPKPNPTITIKVLKD